MPIDRPGIGTPVWHFSIISFTRETSRLLQFRYSRFDPRYQHRSLISGRTLSDQSQLLERPFAGQLQ